MQNDVFGGDEPDVFAGESLSVREEMASTGKAVQNFRVLRCSSIIKYII